FVTVRILLLPAPGILHHARQVEACLPAKFFLRFISIGITTGDISWTAGCDAIWHLTPTGGFKRLDDLQHGITSPRAQIVSAAATLSSPFSAATWPCARSTT